MVPDAWIWLYREEFGILFPIFSLMYLLNPLLCLWIYSYKRNKIQGIEKVRYNYIFWWYFIFIFFFVLFLAILPMFWIWIMQKEQIIFFIPFILSSSYVSYKYKVWKFPISLGKAILLFLSIWVSFLFLHIFKLYFSLLSPYIHAFWWTNSWISSSIFDFTSWIILFYLFYKYLSKSLFGSWDNDIFEKHIQDFKEKLPFLETKEYLNSFLKSEFKNKLNLGNTSIVFLNDIKNRGKYSELVKYFLVDYSRDIFLNDIVFIDENKTKYDKEKLIDELDEKIWIYIPIFKNRTSIEGFLCVGRKFFSDYYLEWEIEALKSFSTSLQWHLKYLSVYKRIQDLSINLDKQVDEKTIEYNNLLNKQKEFIAYMGHEIKNPITNSIFLCDSLVDEIRWLKEWNVETSKKLDEDGKILYDELIKVSKLVKNIFSTEQFDLNKVKLYRKTTEISQFLRSELRVFENSFPHIYFDIQLKDVGDKKIDETQFRQVIHNLLTNATKFAYKEKPRVHISLRKDKNGKIEIVIEDNGAGFKEIDIEQIFDKYATGDGSSVGLGMGLYLCKKIVELHKWTIVASNGEKLGGAKFTITF